MTKPAPDIWLEPECCGAPDTGQMWCPDNIFYCENGVEATHYVLASRLEKAEESIYELAKDEAEWQLRALRAEDNLNDLKYRHAALIEIYSDEKCVGVEYVEKRIDDFISEEQSHS